MKTTKIAIKNLFGITEMNLDGKSIELSGTNGTGKTSVLDAIKYALTNDSERKYIIKKGAEEGQILIETDAGISIKRKKRENQVDYKKITQHSKDINKPESFLQEIFTPLQLNPVEFTRMSEKDQNRIILDLIEFEWDLNWIREQFNDIPGWVNYEQNILNVLNEIQSEKGDYYLNRQDINRDIRHKKDHVAEIAATIPDNYNAEFWSNYNFSQKHKELATIVEENNKIDRAIHFKETYDNKLRGLEAEREITIHAETKAIELAKINSNKTIDRLRAELKAEEEKLLTLDSKLEDKIKIIEAEHKEKVAKLDADTGIALNYAERPKIDTNDLQNELNTAEDMIKHMNEYKRMQKMRDEINALIIDSDNLTQKIELARNLPSEILKEANIPVQGLTVVDGIALINGLPVSNLSEGEKLKLCVDIAVSKTSQLQIILLDGVEKLSEINRNELYSLCKEKGLQFIATRTTNDDELNIITL